MAISSLGSDAQVMPSLHTFTPDSVATLNFAYLFREEGAPYLMLRVDSHCDKRSSSAPILWLPTRISGVYINSPIPYSGGVDQ